jgi:hypothetical protein
LCGNIPPIAEKARLPFQLTISAGYVRERIAASELLQERIAEARKLLEEEVIVSYT